MFTYSNWIDVLYTLYYPIFDVIIGAFSNDKYDFPYRNLAID